MNPFKKHICGIISGITKLSLSEIEKTIEVPPDGSWGDYGWPCFQLAKTYKKAPPSIASELAEKIPVGEYIESVSAKGPYLNFTLNKQAVIKHIIHQIFTEENKYGSLDIGKGKNVIVEYSSPNIAKPMGIQHLRSTVIGAALKRIYERLGYNVISINHIGDWGTQFGKLAVAYKRWVDESKLADDPLQELFRIYVKLHEEAEKDKSIEDESRAMFKKLEDGDPEIIELWRKFVDLTWQEFKRIYDILGVRFDSVAGESFYHKMIPDIINVLDEKKLCAKSQGALIVPLDDYNLEPMLLRKKDGSTLYSTRDLAAAIYRHKTYNFDKMLYVVGVAQILHFKQLFKVLELAGFEWFSECRHIDFGWVKLGAEMMSTRKGKIILLKDVLDQAIEKAYEIVEKNNPDLENKEQIARQVGIGAVIFTQLSVKRQTDVSFDWDRMLDFQGYSGPYLQYAHARLSSVLRKHGEKLDVEADYGLLTLPEEYGLAKMLMEFPEKIRYAANNNEPYIIFSYLFDLVSLFSTYFQKYKSPADKILSDNPELRKAKINLAYCVKTVLKTGLSIQGLEAPERM
ncbi:MAG: arginine--tRNA ligase [candidate division Zixibacteria bacterium]|nr:arginine--tRNA ligase [candidate division Zixibacteria bacterium]